MEFNRRKFIKTGGLMLGSLAAPSMFGSNKINLISNDPATMNFAMEHFGVTESQLKQVLSTALEKGGKYADLFFEHTFSNSLRLQDGTVNRASSNIDFGMGVRVVAGEQTGYAYVENITIDEMLKAARTAARIANENGSETPADLTDISIKNSLYKVKTAWEEVAVKNKMPYLQKINDQMFAADNRVTKVSAWLSDTTSHVMFCNSEGHYFYDYRPMVMIGAQCIMTEGDRMESNSSSRALRMGAEFLTDDLVGAIVHEAIEKTSILFKAIKPKGGEMPVVMGAGGSGILLHEAIGHAFEADFNRKNTSIFSDKLNKIVCDSTINIVDDGTIPSNRGSVNIDDEGIRGQKTYIVREGVLTSYLHDRISAKFYNVAPTGNGRRETFRNMPIPRMRATYMEAGKYSEEEIIASVKSGVYVSNFTNGQVQIGAGDFTFFVKNGYLIEDGKLAQPIKDINIIGNGPKALADITMVGSNFMMDEGSWTCGKDGQSCPVTLGMPSALVSKLTVGGEN
ncbi:MAG: TldD/PmbA family protein [Tannerella sp.]|jgi:TldD protein|nr:TldD/PmbA family protein [Tannerella sp.]